MTTTTKHEGLTFRGVNLSEKSEEVYFTFTTKLPRVGEVSSTFIARRYVARIWNDDNTSREGWTNWQIRRQDTPSGVGPKASSAWNEAAEEVINDFLANDEAYYRGWQNAIARMIERAANDRYGIGAAKRLFEEYRRHLDHNDRFALAHALEQIENGYAALAKVGADE